MRVIFNILTIIVLLLTIGLYSKAYAQNFSDMLHELEKYQSSPDLIQKAMDVGEQRALLCSQCHGADGNSTKPEVPNLAAQNPVYLLRQIQKFSEGSRKNFVMNALSKNFTLHDKVNLAIYYANMKVRRKVSDPLLASKGRALYQNKCSSCHGEAGIGMSDYARLAGQQAEYVELTLRQFRQNLTSNSGSNTVRKSSIMEEITKVLSDGDIESLAAYVSQLQ